MNHVSGAVAPPDTEVAQAGNAIWDWAKRRDLVQGAVRAVRVAEVLVPAQDAHLFGTYSLPSDRLVLAGKRICGARPGGAQT